MLHFDMTPQRVELCRSKVAKCALVRSNFQVHLSDVLSQVFLPRCRKATVLADLVLDLLMHCHEVLQKIQFLCCTVLTQRALVHILLWFMNLFGVKVYRVPYWGAKAALHAAELCNRTTLTVEHDFVIFEGVL